MIFVTVGTDCFEFERLLREIDLLAVNLNIQVVVQYGHNKYIPKNCECYDFFSYDEMLRFIKNSEITITHASSTALLSLSLSKIPIIVPRRPELREIVDDHQVRFAQNFGKMAPVIVTVNVKELEYTITNYKNLCRSLEEAYDIGKNESKASEAIAKLDDLVLSWFPAD